MNTSMLEQVGFTVAESKVYLSLLELGKTKSGPVVAACGLQPSVVFLALSSLKQKGLHLRSTLLFRK